jgi:hypothetical protein
MLQSVSRCEGVRGPEAVRKTRDSRIYEAMRWTVLKEDRA